MSVTNEIFMQVSALQNRYIRVIDDDQLEQWPALFVENGSYKIVSQENLSQNLPLAIMSCEGQGMMKDRITGLRKINVYEPQHYSHQISGLEIEHIDENTVQAISNYLVVRTMQSGSSTIFASGTYRDKIQLDAVAAKFIERVVVTDSRQIDTLLVIPL